MRTATEPRPNIRRAENSLLSLRMAGNSIALRKAASIRNPEQRALHERSTRARAEDEAKRPFDKRHDLRKSKRERDEMNRAYCLLMGRHAYEGQELRARAARHYEAWIARYARPNATAERIVNFCAEAGGGFA